MTNTAAWHRDTAIDATPYPTRQPNPGFTGDQHDAFGPGIPHHGAHVHEAAHAVLMLAGGTTVTGAELTGCTGTTGFIAPPLLRDGEIIALAAGERAVDRWLHETGLWTPRRALAAELAADHDRAKILACRPAVGFGDTALDYADVHAAADDALQRHWLPVLAVATQLSHAGRLTGRQIATLAGLPYPQHPAQPPTGLRHAAAQIRQA